MAQLLPGFYEYQRQQAFSLKDVDHEFVRKYHPRFLAVGGMQAVYEIPKHPDIIVKAGLAYTRAVIVSNLKDGRPLDSCDGDIKDFLRREIKEERDRFQLLKKYFGKEGVLPYKKFITKIPIAPGMRPRIFPKGTDNDMQEVWSIVMVQKRTREIQDPDHFMVCSGYAESGKHGMVDEETYQKVTNTFLFGKNQQESFDREEFLSVQRTPMLRKLLDQCDKDEGFRQVLKELVEKIIMYVQDTDEILDLAGKDNLILYQKNGTWKYQLVDALFPWANGLGEARRALAMASRGEDLSESESDMLLNGVNFVRTMNGLAAYLGVPDRLTLRSSRFVPGWVNVLSTLQAVV